MARKRVLLWAEPAPERDRRVDQQPARFSQEGQRLADPKAGDWTLPTALERRGDFSRTRNATGGPRTIYGPWTTVFDAKQNRASRQPFAGKIIPAALADPVSRNVPKQIREPNRSGDDITGVTNFRLTFPDTCRYWNLSNRFMGGSVNVAVTSSQSGRITA